MREYNWKDVASVITANVNRGEWPCIAFTSTVMQAKALAEEISVKLDQKISVVHAGIALETRQALVALMQQGAEQAKVVVSVKIWSTGIDIPCLKAIYNCGVKYAVIPLIQQAGRAGRIAEGKSSCMAYEVFTDGEESALHWRIKAYQSAGYEISADSERVRRMLASSIVKPVSKQASKSDSESSFQLSPLPLSHLIALVIPMIMSPAVWIIFILALTIGTCMGVPGS